MYDYHIAVSIKTLALIVCDCKRIRAYAYAVFNLLLLNFF